MKMNKEYCRDCVCLSEDEDSEWFCDEAQKKIKDIEVCPEVI